MTQQKQWVAETGCDNCPAYRRPEVLDAHVQNLTAVPSQMVAQVTDGTWHALLTSVGRGKFLIRRRKSQAANTCPLLSYEVRHIKTAGGEGPKSTAVTAGGPAGKRKSREACRELLMLVLMGQI